MAESTASAAKSPAQQPYSNWNAWFSSFSSIIVDGATMVVTVHNPVLHKHISDQRQPRSYDKLEFDFLGGKINRHLATDPWGFKPWSMEEWYRN